MDFEDKRVIDSAFFGDIKIGEVFGYNGEYYMKIPGCVDSDRRQNDVPVCNCVVLTGDCVGILCSNKDDRVVYRVQPKLLVYRPGEGEL